MFRAIFSNILKIWYKIFEHNLKVWNEISDGGFVGLGSAGGFAGGFVGGFAGGRAGGVAACLVLLSRVCVLETCCGSWTGGLTGSGPDPVAHGCGELG